MFTNGHKHLWFCLNFFIKVQQVWASCGKSCLLSTNFLPSALNNTTSDVQSQAFQKEIIPRIPCFNICGHVTNFPTNEMKTDGISWEHISHSLSFFFSMPSISRLCLCWFEQATVMDHEDKGVSLGRVEEQAGSRSDPGGLPGAEPPSWS